MSFRKRNERINISSAVKRNPISTSSISLGREPPHISSRRTVDDHNVRSSVNQKTQESDNPGVKPSIITSGPTISTGVSDLDKILLHQGLPVGCSLLVEETGTSDYSSIILKSFASQGVMHNRIQGNERNCHVIVVGASSNWLKELFGIYKGSTKEQKKAKIQENENKVSVSNLAVDSNRRDENNMKIAWRYGLNRKVQLEDPEIEKKYEFYNHQFDITQKLLPGPSTHDISSVPVNTNFKKIIESIEGIIKMNLRSNPSKIIRLVVPSFLHPLIYPPGCSQATFVIPFMHSLRQLLRKYSKNLVFVSSIALSFYPRDSIITASLENLMDSVICLQPFNQEMAELINRAYRNEPSKAQQGLVNIFKIPILSEKGLMLIQEGEYAFKNGRKKFEIEEWGIPVDDVDDVKREDLENHSQTTKNIDF
ncbi:uncharacterized protein PRCAT00001167001 [Priceomyces carsonii]|uniref:uncharacterized protein n=1 Tax=Priceomyces carsonii TaxID=28549 RepID=UPI002ED7C874|nr:unnamed protein product [Priceomyces carsonii]